MVKEEAGLYLTTGYLSAIYHKFIYIKERIRDYPRLDWLILFVSAINVILIGGKRRAFGLFISELKNDFNTTSLAELNFIGDSYAALGFFLMPFFTSLLLHLNRPYRKSIFIAGIVILVSCLSSASVPSPGYLFFTHTIIHGIGSTMVLCTTALITGQYFDKNHKFHVFATTFVSGGPYGVLICGPLFALWISEYGWRMGFNFCGILFFLAAVLASIFYFKLEDKNYENLEGEDFRGKKDQEEEKEEEEDKKTDSLAGQQQDEKEKKKSKFTLKKGIPAYLQFMIKEPNNSKWAFCSVEHLFENKQIFIWIFERLLHNFVMYGLMMNMVTYVRDHLQNELYAASRINTYFGIGESIIFTITAIIGDRIRGYLAMMYLIGAIFAALFLLIIAKTYSDITVISVLSAFVGASIGSGNCFLYATSEEIMLIHGSVSFPMTKMVAGIGMILAPLLSGTIIDKFKFKGFFTTMAVLVCFRVILLFLLNISLYFKKKEALEEMQKRGIDLENKNHCCQVNGNHCGLKKTITTTENDDINPYAYNQRDYTLSNDQLP